MFVSSSRWMTTAEAARLLGVTSPTVLRWLRKGDLDGQLTARGMRQVWRVRRESAELLLDRRGGPGGLRGRPPGSVAELAATMSALQQRIAALEARTGAPTGKEAEASGSDAHGSNAGEGQGAVVGMDDLVERLALEGLSLTESVQRLIAIVGEARRVDARAPGTID